MPPLKFSLNEDQVETCSVVKTHMRKKVNYLFTGR
jgi:hypothetical protein